MYNIYVNFGGTFGVYVSCWSQRERVGSVKVEDVDTDSLNSGWKM